MDGRSNKQLTNNFNKQIPIGISHEAKRPQLECSQGPAVAHYKEQPTPEALDLMSSSLRLLSMEKNNPPCSRRGGEAGLSVQARGRLLHLEPCLQGSEWPEECQE